MCKWRLLYVLKFLHEGSTLENRVIYSILGGFCKGCIYQIESSGLENLHMAENTFQLKKLVKIKKTSREYFSRRALGDPKHTDNIYTPLPTSHSPAPGHGLALQEILRPLYMNIRDLQPCQILIWRPGGGHLVSTSLFLNRIQRTCCWNILYCTYNISNSSHFPHIYSPDPATD